MRTETQAPPAPDLPPKPPAPSPNQKASPAVILTDAQKYATAYKQTWNKLPRWKQIIITDDLPADARFVNEFLTEVTRLAEIM